MSNLKEKLLSLRASVPSEMVEVPGVGQVEVRGLTAAGRDEWEQRMISMSTRKNMRAAMISLCLFEDGKRMFGWEDLDALGDLPAAVVYRLWDVATRLSGLAMSDREELEKN